MTLEEAIEHYEKLSKEAEEYRQLVEWLMELKKYREKDRDNNYDVCLGGFHLD